MSCLNFVKKSKNPKPISIKAFEAIVDEGVERQWITEEDCLAFKKKQKHKFFVFEEFDGKAFETIKNLGFRIFGPQCILIQKENSEAVPNVPHPIFCFAMKGIILTCTNLSKDVRADVYQKVEWMGGVVSKCLGEETTHLIAASVGNKKYLVASHKKASIYTPEWVHKVWTECQSRIIHGDDKEFDVYKCPVFKGLHICVSGIATSKRAEVKRLVEDNGGSFNGSLKVNQCTHLVLTRPSGPKYEVAVKWNIATVTLDWLYDSVSTGYCMDEAKYRLQSEGSKSPTITSTPNSNRNAREEFGDISCISTATIDESDMSTLCKTKSSINDTNRINKLANVDLDSIKNCPCFDGCKIYVCVTSASLEDKLRVIINKGYGARYTSLTSCISHVVLDTVTPQLIEDLKKLDNPPHLVTVDWLVDSIRSSKCQPIGNYTFKSDELSFINKKKGAEKVGVPSVRSDDGGNMGAILSQYIPDDIMGESTVLRAMADLNADFSGFDSCSSKKKKEESGREDETLMNHTDQTGKVSLQRHESVVDEDVTMGNKSKTLSFTRDVTMHRAGVSKAADDDDETMDMKQANASYNNNDNTSYNKQNNTSNNKKDNTSNNNRTINNNNQTSTSSNNQTLDKKQVSTSNKDATMASETNDATNASDEDDVRIFEGLTFAVFVEDQKEEVCACIQDFGGKVVEDGEVDVGVVELTGSTVTCHVKHVVTTAWVSMCTTNEELLPYDKLEIFKPLSIKAGCTPFQGLCINISGLSVVEKDVLSDMVTHLGGLIQDTFVRTNKGKYIASTHLVAEQPQGNKFNAAVKWNVPIVTKGWLFECARTGVRVPEERFSLLPPDQPGDQSMKEVSKQDVSNKENIKTPKNNTPSNKHSTPQSNNTSKTISPKLTTPQETKSTTNATSTPITTTPKQANNDPFKTPLTLNSTGTCKSASIATDATKPFISVDSRRKSLRNSRVNALILEDKHTAGSNRASIDTPGKFLYNDDYRITSFDASLSNMPSPLGEQSTRVSLSWGEAFRQNIECALRNNSDDSYSQQQHQDKVPSDPLSGVVLCVGKKLSKRQVELKQLATSLGAHFHWMYQNDCTHFVFQGKQNDLSKDFRMARDQGKHIVSPYWITACYEQKAWLDEALYPHTLSPSSSLSILSQKTPCRDKKVKEVESTNNTTLDLSPKPIEDSQTNRLIDGLKKINESTKSNRGKSRMKTVVDKQHVIETMRTLSRNSSGETKEMHTSPAIKTKKPLNNEQVMTQQSQDVVVEWEDAVAGNLNLPRGDMGGKIYVGELINTDQIETHEANKPCEKTPPSNIPQVKKFSFSGFDDKDIAQMTKQVTSLGGISLPPSKGFHPECTHLITKSPVQSEKFLAAISSGRWILHKTFLSSSVIKGCFLKEEDYEWHSEEKKWCEGLKEQSKMFAKAAHYWRVRIQSGEMKGAFDGWRCLILTDEKRYNGFKRLLVSGGASVLNNQSPLKSSGATHALIEEKMIKNKTDLQEMAKAGILCLRTDYLIHYLNHHPNHHPSSFYIDPSLQPFYGHKRRSSDSSDSVEIKKLKVI